MMVVLAMLLTVGVGFLAFVMREASLLTQGAAVHVAFLALMGLTLFMALVWVPMEIHLGRKISSLRSPASLPPRPSRTTLLEREEVRRRDAAAVRFLRDFGKSKRAPGRPK